MAGPRPRRRAGTHTTTSTITTTTTTITSTMTRPTGPTKIGCTNVKITISTNPGGFDSMVVVKGKTPLTCHLSQEGSVNEVTTGRQTGHGRGARWDKDRQSVFVEEGSMSVTTEPQTIGSRQPPVQNFRGGSNMDLTGNINTTTGSVTRV